MNTHVSNHSSRRIRCARDPKSRTEKHRTLGRPRSKSAGERITMPAALKDLAENIKAVQVIEPIIVRPKTRRGVGEIRNRRGRAALAREPRSGPRHHSGHRPHAR